MGKPCPKQAPRVLVVDDDDALRAICAVALSLAGCRVVQACDGGQALEWLSRHETDVLIVDVHMPRLRGDELLARLQAVGRLPPLVLVMSSIPRNDIWQRVQDLGAHAFLEKPFGAAGLVACLQQGLIGSQAARAQASRAAS